MLAKPTKDRGTPLRDLQGTEAFTGLLATIKFGMVRKGIIRM